MRSIAFHTCGLVSDGSLQCWGRNVYGQTTVPLYYAVYTAGITPSAPGTVTVDLPANSAQNMADSGNTAAAQFSIVYAPNHTVTFNANGGTGTMTPQASNVPAALNANTFSRTGYTFAGWSTTPTGAVVYSDGATYDFSADIILYAQADPSTPTPSPSPRRARAAATSRPAPACITTAPWSR